MLPIFYGSVAIAYALGKAYPDNYWFAFSFGTFFITLGAMLGAVAAFLIARYFLAKFLRKACFKTNKNMEAIDQVVQEDVSLKRGFILIGLETYCSSQDYSYSFCSNQLFSRIYFC